VRRADEGLRAILDPAHRPTEAAGQVGDGDVFWERLALGSKTSTYIGYDHPDLLGRHLQHRCQVSFQPVRSLMRTPNRETAAILRLRQEGSSLHGGRGEALLTIAGLDHNVRVLPHLVLYRLADARLAYHVAQPREQLGCLYLRGLGGIEEHRQFVYLDTDRIYPVFRGVAVLGEDDCHGLPHVAHPPRGQSRPLPALQLF
jgi:hypothetical protein